MTPGQRHIVDMNAPVPVPPWEPPPADGCGEDEYVMPLPPGTMGASDQLITRLRYDLDSGELVDFAFIQQSRVNGQWKTTAETDCHHGHAHLHRHNDAGQRTGDVESLYPIGCAADVQLGYNCVIDHLLNHWRQYRKG